MGEQTRDNPSGERLGQVGGWSAGGARTGERRIVTVHDPKQLTRGGLGRHADFEGLDDDRQRSEGRDAYCNEQLQEEGPLSVAVLNPKAGFRRMRWMVAGEVRVNRSRVVMVRRVIVQMRMDKRRADRRSLHGGHEHNRDELSAHASFLPGRSSLSRSGSRTTRSGTERGRACAALLKHLVRPPPRAAQRPPGRARIDICRRSTRGGRVEQMSMRIRYRVASRSSSARLRSTPQR